jgi:hypothetical protein
MYLVFLQAVLEDVLDDQGASLTKSNFMPHTPKSLIDILHDLRWRLSPAKLEELLPDVASISVNDRLGNATKKLMNHDSLVILRNGIECLLNDVATESIHREIQGVASNGFSNLYDLFRSSVLKATLNQEVSKAVDHQWIGLRNDCLNNVVLLLGCTDLKLLLQENGSLLIIIAHDLVDNVLPVAVDCSVKEATIVERLSGWQIGLTFSSNGLDNC